MQRVRMSLPFYEDFGWEAEVVTVDKSFSDMAVDELLLKSIPPHIPIHYVRALSKSWTSKIGLGSIAIRSLPFYRKKVSSLLKQKKYDLIFFSTTQFPVCILGAFWKKRFNVPYVIDMQDPWHSDYYNNKPKNERPPKYWAAYRINKFLEPIAMKKVDGLIAVSQPYLDVLTQRYPRCNYIPKRTITFGAFEIDFRIAKENRGGHPLVLVNEKNKKNVVYVGRGGKDMADAIGYLFKAFKRGLEEDFDNFKGFHFYFIGTSYASAGKGEPTIAPIAASLGLTDFVTEITDRIPFYQTLNTLLDADVLFVPGSNDAQYTASKIYPYVLANKPLLAIFHPASSVVPFLQSAKAGAVLTFNEGEKIIIEKAKDFLSKSLTENVWVSNHNEDIIKNFSAKAMTKQQCELFDEVLNAKK